MLPWDIEMTVEEPLSDDSDYIFASSDVTRTFFYPFFLFLYIIFTLFLYFIFTFIFIFYLQNQYRQIATFFIKPEFFFPDTSTFTSKKKIPEKNPAHTFTTRTVAR
jgi:hypothetical protein